MLLPRVEPRRCPWQLGGFLTTGLPECFLSTGSGIGAATALAMQRGGPFVGRVHTVWNRSDKLHSHGGEVGPYPRSVRRAAEKPHFQPLSLEPCWCWRYRGLRLLGTQRDTPTLAACEWVKMNQIPPALHPWLAPKVW